MGAVACPFPYLRFPGYIGGRFYACAIVYTYLDNFVMMYVGFLLDRKRARIVFGQSFCLTGLAVMSVCSALGFALLFSLMRKTHRCTVSMLASYRQTALTPAFVKLVLLG